MKAYYLSLSQENFFALEEALEIAISTCDVPASYKKQHDLYIDSLQELLFCMSKKGKTWEGHMPPNRLAPSLKYLDGLCAILQKSSHPFKSAVIALLSTLRTQGQAQDPSFQETMTRFSSSYLASV